MLRDAQLVKARREGRHAFYSLHDHRVPDFLAALRHHYEHAEQEKPPTDLRTGTGRAKATV